MAQSIGSASLVLSTSAGKLYSGLQEAGSKSVGWASSTAASVSSKLGGIGGKLAGFLKAGPHIAAIAAVGTVMFEAIAHPFEKLGELGGIKKMADTLGISASQFQGLSKQLARVGIEGDAVSHTFLTMGKNVADAAGGHGRAAPALAQLGIDARQLLSLPVDEQFKSIADAISKLPPGAQQASAALHIFGDAGAKLLPILQKGGQGIQEFIEAQKKTGAVLSDDQIKAAADAQKAWKEAKAQIASVWEGLANRATLIAAPVIKFIGGAITKIVNMLLPVFDWLGRAIGQVAEVLGAVFEVMGEWFSEAVKWVQDLIGEWFSFGDSSITVQKVVLMVMKAIGQGFGYLWDTIKAGAGVMAWVTSWIVKGFAHIVDAFKWAVKGLLEIAGELPDDLGGKWFRDQAEAVGKWGNGLHKTADDMKKWGETAISSWGDSADKIGKWFDKLGNKRKEDAKQAKQDVAETVAMAAEYKGINSVLKGSKEAYSIESKFRWDGQQAAKTEAAKALEEQKKANAALGKIAELLRLGMLVLAPT